MSAQFKSNFYKLLKKDSRLWDKETKELNETLLKDLIDRQDENIIELFLSDKEIKEKFFIKIKDVYVFKQSELKFFIDESKLDNSYTQYQNKIGLRVGSKLLNEITEKDVVLEWPFKDCVLEGGMTKEDQKRKEIFFNEVLAKDEIDRLLEPKVLVNWKRYTDKGVKKVTEIKRDKEINRKRGLPENTITENLIIKGNNLLALHILKEQFHGKVKLIYIDPPYYFHSSKKEDTFAYNSNFKLSTWLTFMKNRLEIAREFLSEDGALCVQISDDGVGELHVLLKDVFNKPNSNNFINKITIKTKSPSGFASVNPGVFETAEYILMYAKNKKKWKYNPQFVATEYDSNYKWMVKNKKDLHTKWIIKDLFEYVAKLNGYKSKKEAENKMHKSVFLQIVSEYAIDNAEYIFRYTEIGDDAGKETVQTRELSKKNKDIIYKVTRDGKYDVYILNGREMAFYSKKIRTIDGKKVPSIQLSNIWTDVPYEGIAKEGDVTLKGGKKPEKLLRRIIDIATNEEDLVLDYHVGSGTTCAVSHKSGRQYIGIEQLDYGDDDSVVRLKNVINGDQSGVSKVLDWKGGKDFIYVELAIWNQEAKEKILKAENLNELEKLFDELYERYFLNYTVKTKEFKEKTIKEEGFKKLSLKEQKKLFVEMLDMNQMYVNFSERTDKKYSLSEEDIALTEEFYNSEK